MPLKSSFLKSYIYAFCKVSVYERVLVYGLIFVPPTQIPKGTVTEISAADKAEELRR